MVNLIDWLLDLFRDPAQAAAFVANPDQAMADAGLSSVTSAQLAAVASTAIPSLALSGGGDPVVGPQQAVTSHHGFAPAFLPPPLSDTNTDPLSGNPIFSPTTHNSPNGNTVNNGSIHAGAGSSVAVGDHNGISAGNTTAGGDVLSSHDETVFQTSGHGTTSVADGNTTTVHGNQTITDIHGSGNTSGVDNNTHVIHPSTTDNTGNDSSVHPTSVLDSPVHDCPMHDSSEH